MAKKKENNSGFIWLLAGGAALFFFKGQSNSGSGSGSGTGSTSSSPNRSFTEADLRSAFQKALATFGDKIAGETEQLYRKETRNFDSGQFRKTFTPGMEIAPGNNTFPYGWGSLNDFLAAYPKYKGNFFIVAMTENNTGITKKYIGFPTLEGAVMFVAYTIKRRGMAGYWRSWDEAQANAYYQSLLKFPIQFT